MEGLIPVNIIIGDRSYRIKVSAEDEEQVRKTVKTINDKVIEFKTNFSGKDMQDYIAMVLIWYATQVGSVTAAAEANSDDSTTISTLQKMEAQLTQLLSTEEQ
jgi:cell division protein ZapA